MTQNSVEYLSTTNLHLATFLATVGTKPSHVSCERGLTPQGDKKLRFWFVCSPEAERAVAIWEHYAPTVPAITARAESGSSKTAPPAPKPWEKMTLEEQSSAVDILTATLQNLRGFLAIAKDPQRAAKNAGFTGGLK